MIKKKGENKMTRKAQTIGEAVNLIHAALEHENHAWPRMMKGLGYTDKDDFYPKDPERFKVGTAEYHYAVVYKYLMDAVNGFHNMGVIVDGQLCPYQDCSWNCGFDKTGRYICPNCKRAFCTDPSDSDFEDWHTYRDGECPEDIPPKPNKIPLAQDLGPSWGTPDDNPAKNMGEE